MLPFVVVATCGFAADEPDSESDSAGARAVGGALAGWGAVPLADEVERARGMTHLWGQLQVWTTLFDQDRDPQADPATYGDPEADPGFTLRRARLGLDGFVPMGSRGGRNQIDYALAFGTSAPYDVLGERNPEDIQLVDGFARWALPTTLGTSSVGAGLQRLPFSREAMISSAHLPFQEVGVGTNWLVPSREVGILASQSVVFSEDPLAPQVIARVGAFNGGGDLLGDQGPGLLVAGRLEFALGDTYRTWSSARDPAVGIGVAGYRDAEIATTTQGAEVDLLARYSIVTLMGEVVTASITPSASAIAPPSVRDGLRQVGFMGQLSVWVPIDGPHGLEVATRVATYDDATAIENNGDVTILHAGLTWRDCLPRTDLGAGFIHREERAGLPNDTARVWIQVRPEARF